jgi:hypothetical protein
MVVIRRIESGLKRQVSGLAAPLAAPRATRRELEDLERQSPPLIAATVAG